MENYRNKRIDNIQILEIPQTSNSNIKLSKLGPGIYSLFVSQLSLYLLSPLATEEWETQNV